jgi:hypothetical protein
MSPNPDLADRVARWEYIDSWSFHTKNELTYRFITLFPCFS